MIDWPTIVKEYGPMVWRSSYRLLRHEADAADCYQETFLAAFGVAERETVREWPALLKRIATARALDRLRRRIRQGRRQEAVSDWRVLADRETGPAARSEADELAGQLRLALAQLPNVQSEVFCLRWLEEMSYDQIAEQLNLEANHVGVLLHRARRRLRELLAAAGSGAER